MTVNLKVTSDRVSDLPFSVYRKSGQDPDSQARFIAHFAIDEKTGEYMTVDQALAALDELSLGEVTALAGQIRTLTEETAAPKA